MRPPPLLGYVMAVDDVLAAIDPLLKPWIKVLRMPER